MPQRTIQLLDTLQALGFTDEHFSMIHHFQQGETIARMRAYCETVQSFQTQGKNDRLRQRLEIVLNLFHQGNYARPLPHNLFRSLCDQAVQAIPK